MAKLPQTNFAHLDQHDAQLLRLGMLAEKYFAEDPNTSLLKLRQLSELLAQLVAAQTGQLVAPEETQYDLLRRLQDSGILPREVAQLFNEVRRTGNAASHALEGDHRGALSAMKLTWQLSLWFHRRVECRRSGCADYRGSLQVRARLVPRADGLGDMLRLPRTHRARLCAGTGRQACVYSVFWVRALI
jgi:hypothetical protein